jgi:AraC family transcriptional regulator
VVTRLVSRSVRELPLSDDVTQRYAARFRKVIAYIDQYPDEVLGLERLSAVAALSPCHFHRQFAATRGVRVSQYVLLLRMKRATHRLAYRREMTVLDVALAGGYSAPEPCARALRRLIGAVAARIL